MTPEDFQVQSNGRFVLMRCPNEGCDWNTSRSETLTSLWTLRAIALEHILEGHDS